MKPNLRMLFCLLPMVLSACGGGASPSAPVAEGPTVDPNLVFTSGAQTVVAQITLDAASRPVPTAALPPTQTQDASLPTMQPIASSGALPTLAAVTPGALAGAVITQPVAVAAMPTLAGAATLAPAAPAVTAGAVIADKMQWISNNPPDKSTLKAGAKFKITWKLSNIGTTTWDKTYTYKFYAGTQLAVNSSYPVLRDVKPNTTTDLQVDAVAPTTAGDYSSIWVLQRPDGVNIRGFSIDITVK